MQNLYNESMYVGEKTKKSRIEYWMLHLKKIKNLHMTI